MAVSSTTILLTSLFLAFLGACGPPPEPPPPPNVVLLLADDMGFSDLGSYGGEIATPNLDALAADGLRFSQFYNAARCWPSRAALLTGYYPQQVRRDTVPGVRSGAGGRRPAWGLLLSERLRDLGYRSFHSGKWHLDRVPLAEGFRRSYDLRDTDRYFGPLEHQLDGERLPEPAPDDGYYATDAIAGHAIDFLEAHHDSEPGRPFFLYVAFTAPHFPLQAPAASIARYRQRYDAGWDNVRLRRWQQLRRQGLLDVELSAPERWLGPPYRFPEAIEALGPGEVDRPKLWSDLEPVQRDFQAAKMAVHAAMVERMDEAVGRIVERLRDLRLLRDTLILFLSDNGASAEIMVRGDGHDPRAASGSARTYLSLGPGWSTVANTPFRRHKTWVHEGGIATPLIVHWPRGIDDGGAVRRGVGHIVDIVPTVLEAAGAPTLWSQIDPTPPGRSLLPLFDEDAAADDARELWWSHEGNDALRRGDWKLVRSKDEPWELYDLAADRTEMHDLARQELARASEMAQRWRRIWSDIRQVATRDIPPPS